MIPKLPGTSNRTTLIGRTGTGKTVAGLWHLSNYAVGLMPWVILDLKGDEHLNSIDKAQHVEPGFVPGKKDRGLFIMHPLPGEIEGKDTGVSKTLWGMWERENCGLFVDEGFMLGSSEPFETLLTQGRSKRCPMIVCTQRPAWISRYVFSEASYIQVFDLNDWDDKKRVMNFVPIEEWPAFGEHESVYFDIARNKVFKFRPVPDMDAIRAKFDAMLPRVRVRI